MKSERKIYVTIALEVVEEADKKEVLQEMYYAFEHKDIISSDFIGENLEYA